MRTKALLALAALAIAIPASAQVYSANVVGYVNVTLKGGYQQNHICNPLKAADNNINALFAGANDGDYIFRWVPGAFDFSSTIPTYGSGAWSDAFELNPGEGIWFINTGDDRTVTFVGEVIQGNFTNNLAGGYQQNSIGSSVPLGGSFTNSIAGIVPNDGDYIFKWVPEAFDFSSTIPTYGSGTWSDADMTIEAGQALMYINTGEPQEWVRNFTVPTP